MVIDFSRKKSYSLVAKDNGVLRACSPDAVAFFCYETGGYHHEILQKMRYAGYPAGNHL